MKIGILTHPPRSNYGGTLQAWALSTVLTRMGHQTEVYVTPRRFPRGFRPLHWAKRAVYNLLGVYDVPVFAEYKVKRDYYRVLTHIQPFIDRNIPIKPVGSMDDVYLADVDAYVIGSDQIWRQQYFPSLFGSADLRHAFLCKAAGKKRLIAYAASFGVDYWQFTPEETADIAAALKQYAGISVREVSGVGLLRDNAGVDSQHVLDPTMLLEPKDYLEMAASALPGPGGIVSYILDPDENTDALISQVKADRPNLSHTELRNPVEGAPKKSIECWVASIAGADVVVTDSFHGCVFAIIFGRPLIFVRNHSRGNARFDSLISTFGIGGNCVSTDGADAPYSADKDYSLPADIPAIIERMREESMAFLSRSLKR